MKELCKRIKYILSGKIIESAMRSGEDLSAEEVHNKLDKLMDEMANFLVEKFDDTRGI